MSIYSTAQQYINCIYRTTILLVILLCITISSVVHAQQRTLSFAEFAGFTLEERIAQNHQIIAWLKHLDETSDRVQLMDVGMSYDHRDQIAAIVTSPENHLRIDEIRENALKLDDPRGIARADLDRIVENQPVVVYLGGGIHGFELSGTEGLLLLLGYLTDVGNEQASTLLENLVVIIDPTINPDGRDAFAQFNLRHLGRVANADPSDWSNDFTSWDGLTYRTSHYYFDLNRDWFAHTHPETRDRAAMLRNWRPQVGIDAHEMGPNVEFYVDPPTDPRSPHFPEYATRWFEKFGRAHAEAFDRHHVEYTKGEIFNFFYPAYFTSYLTYQGAVGMLYEQGSSRGMALEISDGTVRTLEQASRQQYIAFIAALELTSDNRRTILIEYLQANRDAIEAGRSGKVRYIIEPTGDPHLVTEAINMLMRNGVEVHQLTQESQLRGVTDRYGQSVGNRTFPRDTYVIEASQPRMAFIRKLMEPAIPIPDDFLRLARERIDRGENPRFYDITAWSIPLMYNLNGFSSTDSRRIQANLLTATVPPAPYGAPRPAAYAYVIDGAHANALSVIPALRAEGIRVSVLFKPTRIMGNAFASGSVVIRTDGNIDSVYESVNRVAERFKLPVASLDSGMSDEGFPPLGSVEGRRITEPTIAVIGNHPVHAYSFGWVWHTLDREYEIPHTIINTTRIGSIPLERFNVIVLPEITNASLLKTHLGEDGIVRLQRWVRDGGTLVAIGSGAEFVRNHLEMGSLKSWYDTDEHSNKPRISVPGAFFRGAFDSEHWLTSGYVVQPPLLVNSNRLLVEPDLPPSSARRAAIKIADGSGAHIAGHVWEENIERVPGTVFLYDERIGSGRVISFTEDVNFRGYWRGADRLFLNAVILGPSAP